MVFRLLCVFMELSLDFRISTDRHAIKTVSATFIADWETFFSGIDFNGGMIMFEEKSDLLCLVVVAMYSKLYTYRNVRYSITF